MAERTITRRADSVLDELKREFGSLYYTREDFERKITELSRARSDRPSKMKALLAMFGSCGIACGKDQSEAYYRELVERSDIPSISEIEDKMIYALYANYRKYATPADYMKRIVDERCHDEDGWENDTLRVRILKQFIKYGDYLVGAGFNGKDEIRKFVQKKIGHTPTEEEVLRELTDDVFSPLNRTTKFQVRETGKYGLLKAADDLASGTFHADETTKKRLYLFAMVFDMTYTPGDPDDKSADGRDIETNLFRDYYANNLMRYITETYQGKWTQYETDPSGQGINYKNFAEMIYLYYIAKNCSPQEKIRLSTEMIERAKARQYRTGGEQSREKMDTAYFRGFFRADRAEAMLRMSEEAFEEFICEHYDCDTYAGSYVRNGGEVHNTTPFLQLEQEQESAYRVYQEILTDLSDMGVDLKDCHYGLWFTDVDAFLEEHYESVCDRNPDIDRERFHEFMELLFAVNCFLGDTRKADEGWTVPEQRKTRALFVSSAKQVTRTSLIVAYYYRYLAYYEDDEMARGMSFKEVYDDFSAGMNELLSNAYYQKLSSKNVFDVLVVFSAYARLNLQ